MQHKNKGLEPAPEDTWDKRRKANNDTVKIMCLPIDRWITVPLIEQCGYEERLEEMTPLPVGVCLAQLFISLSKHDIKEVNDFIVQPLTRLKLSH